MKRTIFAGVLILTAGLTGTYAQQPAAAPPATPVAKAPVAKSPAELEAVNAIIKAPDPDSTIKAAEDLMTKFADTQYKEFALSMEARAYQQKGDVVNAQLYGERTLELNPKSYMMELLVAEVIAPTIKDHDLDRDAKIAKASKLFNDAIEEVKVAPKPNAQLPDAQWAEAQKYTIAEAHNGLGIVAQVQKKWDDAIKEYQMALDGDPEQDAYATRLANAYLAAGKNAEAIAICDKLLAKPNLHPTIRQVVTSIKTNATKK